MVGTPAAGSGAATPWPVLPGARVKSASAAMRRIISSPFATSCATRPLSSRVLGYCTNVNRSRGMSLTVRASDAIAAGLSSEVDSTMLSIAARAIP